MQQLELYSSPFGSFGGSDLCVEEMNHRAETNRWRVSESGLGSRKTRGERGLGSETGLPFKALAAEFTAPACGRHLQHVRLP